MVLDAGAGGNIKKLPLISHTTVANRNDAFLVLAALRDGATSTVVLTDWPLRFEPWGSIFAAVIGK
jgi:hypothetical protein